MSSVLPSGSSVPGMHESMPETKAISFADDTASFFENLLDIVNPLQHLPVVSTVYRAVTGDQIETPARLIGGALYGGPVGFASVTANLALEEATGNDLAGHVLALVNEITGIDALAEVAAPATAVAPKAVAAVTSAPLNSATEIIWNGPRVLPSLARATPAQSNAGPDRSVEVSSLDSPNASIPETQAKSPNSNGEPRPNKDSAVTPNSSVPPAWLETAIADAQTVQGASQLGKPASKVEAQPWISEAMLDALGKYEALARERNRPPEQPGP